MSFSKALYYPSIDILDSDWLRTACLYWEEIRTIVPESLDNPYRTPDTQALEGEGFLVPLRVDPSMQEVEELADDVLKFLEQPEGAAMLMPAADRSAMIHVEKLPEALRPIMRRAIHVEKFAQQLGRLLSGTNDPMWRRVPATFADFYMTLLASRLADRIGAGLLSPLASADRLATAARLDAITPPLRRPQESEARWRRRPMPGSLAQGSLAHLAIQHLGVHKDTPIGDLLKFRRNHADELGRFRAELGRLTRETTADDLPLEALQQRVADVYENEVKPAIADLQAALKGSGIRSIAEGSLKTAFLSAAPTSALVFAGLSTSIALLAGAGISLTITAVLYHTNRAEQLRRNPYSYLLSMRKLG